MKALNLAKKSYKLITICNFTGEMNVAHTKIKKEERGGEAREGRGGHTLPLRTTASDSSCSKAPFIALSPSEHI
jgi:hypothetical protein